MTPASLGTTVGPFERQALKSAANTAMASASLSVALLDVLGLIASAPLSRRRASAGVPNYVLNHAAIVSRYSTDPYHLSDIAG